MGADWSIFLGILIYIVAVIFSAIYYNRYKIFYLVLYIISVATYIFAVLYTWDVFDLNKNLVMLLLLFSTIIFVFLGKHFSKIELKPSKYHTSLKEKK